MGGLLLIWGLIFLAGLGEVNCCGVVINGDRAITTTDDDFVCATMDWWPPDKCDYGTCSWGLASVLNVNLSNPLLLNAVKAFSPLKIRVGGTLQDTIIYDTGDTEEPCKQLVKNTSEIFGYNGGCLSMSRWDELNHFFKKAGAVIFFGLNALNGRVLLSDGSLGEPWNSTNAAALIRYTVNKGYPVQGWEFGNELSGIGYKARVGVDQYAADTISLKAILDNVYKGSPIMPLVLAPGGNFEADWFSEFVKKTKPNFVDAITHHVYSLGAGDHEDLIEKILDPSYLDKIASRFSKLEGILKSAGTQATAWVGESGGAYNSGRDLVTNAFVSSFWYLDQMAMSATYDTKTYCRQSLIGGNYGLLDTTTFKPNPDYYSALLWRRLMGRKVLSTTSNGTRKLRAYAHCARESEGITLILINLDGNSTAKVVVSSKSPIVSSLNHNVSRFTREEYHLTAPNGNLQSRTMLLNGNILTVNKNGEIPNLEPIEVNVMEPVIVAPFSIVFVHMPSFYAPACK